MSSSEPLIDARFLRRVVLVNALVPAALLVWDAWHGQLGANGVNFVIRTTGMIGLILITLSLVVTPVREIAGWARVVATRRGLGVLGFVYLAVHFAVFLVFDRQASLASTAHEIATRRYLWFGTGALVLMAPLALTSTDAMVVRLGPTAWKRLHRLAYPVAIGAVVHYYLLVKSDVTLPLAFATAIGALLLYRVGRRVVPRPAAPPVPKRVRTWSGELLVSRIIDETADVKTFRLTALDGGPLPFAYAAGQYLNLALTIDGRRVNRSYTIASAPESRAACPGACEISVKRASDGYASAHLHDTLRQGMRVRVSAPAGAFVFAPDGVDRIVMIAGGIGVTPFMSMVRSLTDAGWPGDIHLLYSVRSAADLAFREELARLTARHRNLHVRLVVTRDPSWPGEHGPISPDLIRDFVSSSAPDSAADAIEAGAWPVFLCGPVPMMAAMREMLAGLGVSDDRIHQEAFVSRPAVEAVDDVFAPIVDGPTPAAAAASILFLRSGTCVDAAGDCTVLEAAEDAGIAIPFECRAGICGQCKTRLASGRVAMAVQDALSAADRGRGLILACQARPVEPIEIDA